MFKHPQKTNHQPARHHTHVHINHQIDPSTFFLWALHLRFRKGLFANSSETATQIQDSLDRYLDSKGSLLTSRASS